MYFIFIGFVSANSLRKKNMRRIGHIPKKNEQRGQYEIK